MPAFRRHHQLIELWLIFSVITILCYGTAQQFSKKGVQLIGVYQTGLLYSIAAIIIQTSFWLMNPDDISGNAADVGIAIFAGTTGALGFFFYVSALKDGKVSIVSVITAGYPALAVVLAIIILEEQPGIKEWIGILLVIFSIILLSYPRKEDRVKRNESRGSKKWLIFAILAFILWGIWAVPSKLAMQSIGESDFIFIDGLTMVGVWIPIWLIMGKGRMNKEFRKAGYSGTAGILASIGTVSLFLAINKGDISIVTPMTSIYPLLTIMLARFYLQERLNVLQFCAIGIGLLGIVLLAS